MINLIHLEWRRQGKGRGLRALLSPAVTVVSVLLFCLLVVLTDEEASFGFEYIFGDLTFFILTSVLYGSYVVRDFQTGRIQNVFLYPYSRIKLISAKIIAAFIISFIGNVVMKTAAVGMSSFIYGQLTTTLSHYLTDGIAGSFLLSVSCLLSMQAGIYFRSATACTVSGVILMFSLSSSGSTDASGQVYAMKASMPYIYMIMASAGAAASAVWLLRLSKTDVTR